jgi:hypothetical protein
MEKKSTRLMLVGVIVFLGTIAALRANSTGAAQNTESTTAPQRAEQQIEGNVVQTLDVPGYTYAEIETENGNVWVAAPSITLQQGDTVKFSTGMPMREFYSKTLQREFEVLYFVDRFISDGGVRSIDHQAATAHGGFGEPPAAKPLRDFNKIDGGYTVAEILDPANDLGGETVRVRGQVVKFTPNVLNSHWIRIRDASSTEELVIPTDMTVAINDLVTVEGRLQLDKDLGQGYIIRALLEDARISIE